MTGKKTMASSAAGTSKKPRKTKKATKAKDVPVVVLEDEEDAALTLSVEEKDTLECDICCLPFESQVFMCKNGHSGCANCCLRTSGKCWSCPEPMGIRCRPLEKLLAAATTACKFRKNGCNKAVRYTEKLRHEETCPRAPYDCPIGGCTYSGLGLRHHVAQDHGGPDGFAAIVGGLRGTAVTVHRDAPFRVLLPRDRGDCVFLLLNGRDLLQGRSLSLLCLGPRPESGVELEYEMEVGGAAAPGELALSASGTVPCARRLEGFQAKGFLFVPDAYWGSSGTVSVRVRV